MDLKDLEFKINALEERLIKLEKLLTSNNPPEDKIWMEQLYKLAKDLVIKNNKASVIFLQKKLLIDFQRAAALINELEKNGVIGAQISMEPRKVLVNK